MKSDLMQQIPASIKLEDTHDVRLFAHLIRSWAESNQESVVLEIIQNAESRGMSASELILGYSQAFKELLVKHAQRLPENLRAQLSRAAKVSEDSVNLESYTFGKSKY